MDKDVLRFIDKLYKDLYKSEEVLHHSSGNETDKFNNIEEYLDTLERVHNRAIQTERRINTLKRLYMEKYVIKKEDIPDRYYQNQQRIALERGFGHVEITDEQKRELANEIINNQKRSLENWLDYFFSADSKFYPFWAKYWAFQGMLKLGSYDKSKGTFNKRTKETVAPFADLNQEALSLSMDYLMKYIGKEKIEDQELEQVIASGSFQKIYPYILKNVLSNNENIIKRNEGRWIKYNQGSNHMPLVKSLQGYNTGWCTAGESTAKSQLSKGDFYVYYTLDEKDEYKVPRIAIRMEYDRIAEIRGIAQDQNLEPEMENVVAEKIKDFPDKDKYYKKVNDMKQMTYIYNKWKNNEELTLDELKFLYEIDYRVDGFGYDDDPRIEEIISERNIKEDLSKIFNCDKTQIAFTEKELSNDTICFYGDLDLSNITSAEGLTLPKRVSGNLNLKSLKSAKGLILPQSIGGDLDLSSLETTIDLTLPQSIDGSIDLGSLETAKGLILPQSIGGSLYLCNLKTAEGLILPQSIDGSIDLGSLETAEGLTLPQSIDGVLDLGSLKTAEGLTLPQSISGFLNLRDLKTADGLTLPQSVSGAVYLSSLETAKGLTLPKSIGGDLNLRSLKTADGLTLPQSIGGDLNLRSLETAEGLTLPQSVGGNLILWSLKTAERLMLPQSIGGDLSLWSLKTAECLTLPQSVSGTVYLSSLETAKGLTLPQSIGKDLDLRSLEIVEGLTLPQSVGGTVYLLSLKTAEGLILPDKLTYVIECKGFTITPENVDQYRNNDYSLK